MAAKNSIIKRRMVYLGMAALVGAYALSQLRGCYSSLPQEPEIESRFEGATVGTLGEKLDNCKLEGKLRIHGNVTANQYLGCLDPDAHIREAAKIHFKITSPAGSDPGRTGPLRKDVLPSLEATKVIEPGHILYQRQTSYIVPRPVISINDRDSDALVVLDVSGSMDRFLIRKNTRGDTSLCSDLLDAIKSKIPQKTYAQLYAYRKYQECTDWVTSYLLRSKTPIEESLQQRIIRSRIESGVLSMPSIAAIAIASHYVNSGRQVSAMVFNNASAYTDFSINLLYLATHLARVPSGGTVLDANRMLEVIRHGSRSYPNKPIDIYIFSDWEMENIERIMAKTNEVAKLGRVYIIEVGGSRQSNSITRMFGTQALRTSLSNMDDLSRFYRNFTADMSKK